MKSLSAYKWLFSFVFPQEVLPSVVTCGWQPTKVQAS